jgi:hypothetical protein
MKKPMVTRKDTDYRGDIHANSSAITTVFATTVAAARHTGPSTGAGAQA